MSKKYFINNLDTAFGQVMLEELVKEPTEDPVHMCTLRVPVSSKPNGIKKILKRQKPKLFAKKATEECEVYIYNLDQTELSDIDFGIQMMKKPFEDNKVFILVSDIMSWSANDRKVKPEPKEEPKEEGEQGQEAQVKQNEQGSKAPQEEEGSEKDLEASQEQEEKQKSDEEDEVEQEKPIEYTFYEDTDYEMRIPQQKYGYIKEVEQKVLAVKRQNVKIFIVCPGIIYGCGEDTFYSLFKASWLQQPSKLPYLEDGKNTIPTIHLRDLVKFVIKLAEGPPQEGSPYLLAFDETSDKTQKSIISAISSGIGSGNILEVKESPLIENVDRFRLNLDIQPSKFFVGTAEEPAEFEWTARKGIKENVALLLKDFCQKESHRPMKLMFLQNDSKWRKESKIDFILRTFAEYYRIPILTINQILQYAREFAQGDLLEDLTDEWENIMEYLKNGDPTKRGLDETMKVFYRVVRWRLQRNDCMNRGYILENFPNFRTQLQFIFNKTSSRKFKRKVPKKKKEIPKQIPKQKEAEEGEEQGQQKEDKEQEGKQPEEQPAPEEEPQAQPEQEPPEQQEAGEGPKVEPYYPESVINIKQMGTSDEETLEVIEFFTSAGMDELVYDTTGKKDNEIFESLRSHIERNGRPNNYLVDERELLSRYQELLAKENQESLANRQKRQKDQEEYLADVSKKRQQLAKEMVELVQNEGEEEIKKMPFRNYLMEFVVPTLNEGLLEVSNIIPNDPVDLLAEYLYQKSYDV